MTSAELAVLSLIVEQPRHGYEIEAQIKARGMRDWTDIGFSSIYAILKKLEGKGWVEAHLARSVGQGPPRKVFRANAEGRKAHREAILAVLSENRRPHSPLLIGLANLPVISPAEAIVALGAYCQSLEVQRIQLSDRLEAQRPLPPFVEAMFDYSFTQLESELGWVRSHMQELEANHGES